MRRRFAVLLTTITIQHLHCTQTDYLFMVTACKCQGQTQTGGQRERAATARPLALVRPVVGNGDSNNHSV